MTDTITIELPSTLSVDFREEIGTKSIDLSTKSPEWVAWAIEFALRQSIGDAIAGKTGTEEGLKAIRTKFDRVCIAGEIPAGGSGGGKRLSVEAAGWIEYFKSKEGKKMASFKGRTPNGTNIAEYQQAFVRKAIWPSVRNAIKDLDQEAQRTFHKEKLPGLIDKHFDAVLQQAESNTQTNQPGDFIEIERKKRNTNAIDETFTVEIEIAI